jgi:hypothetical protein
LKGFEELSNPSLAFSLDFLGGICSGAALSSVSCLVLLLEINGMVGGDGNSEIRGGAESCQLSNVAFDESLALVPEASSNWMNRVLGITSCAELLLLMKGSSAVDDLFFSCGSLTLLLGSSTPEPSKETAGI